MSGILSNKEKIEVWVREYSDSMYNWALFRVGDTGTAEDLVQESFLSALHAIDGYKEKSSPRTWLFSILKNKIADHYRKQFKMQIVNESRLSGDGDPTFWERYFSPDNSWKPETVISKWEDEETELLDDMEFRQILEECLKALSRNGFLALQYKYLEEKEGKTICQEKVVCPTRDVKFIVLQLN